MERRSFHKRGAKLVDASWILDSLFRFIRSIVSLFITEEEAEAKVCEKNGRRREKKRGKGGTRE